MTSNHLLRSAAQAGDLARIETRLAAGDEIEGRHTGTGRTPLLEAVIAGHEEAVALLLDRGAALEVSCTAVGETPLGWAAHQGHAGIARLLLERGARVDAVAENSFLGRTPLAVAAMTGHLAVVDALLDAGADPNRPDNRGDNSLSLADERGRAEIPSRLRQAGAEPPAPAEQPDPLPWPELDREAQLLDGFGTPPPDGASPEAVVWSYIRAIHAWEVEAWERLQRASGRGEHHDLLPDIEVAQAIRDAHCTEKRRSYSRVSVGAIPDLTPEIRIVERTEPTRSRIELLLRYPQPEVFVHEYETVLVCLQRHGEWRIDSAKSRLIGTAEWERVIL